MTPPQPTRDLLPSTHAARAGVGLGLYFMLKYTCIMYALEYPMLIFVFILATIAVPFVAYRLTLDYGTRLGQAGVQLNFRLAWSHGTMLYFFASIMLLLPQYLFFTRILPEQIPLLEEMSRQMYEQAPGAKEMLLQIYGAEPADMLRESLQTPILARLIGSLSNNVLVGALLSLINAAILSRKQYL